jgi:hypothetical protein
MAQVIAKCRLTGHYMFMGIDVDAERLKQLPDLFARKFCPFCSCEHDWHRKDAKLSDRRPAALSLVQRAL